MSADSSGGVLRDLDDELTRRLIALHNLSAAEVERISDVMRVMNVSFLEAAIHVGLLALKDIDEASATLPDTGEDDQPGIIETLVRRQAAARNLTVIADVVVKPSRQLVIAHAPDDPRSEAIRALRTELLLRNEPGLRCNMLSLISASAAEGRSQLAAELAIAFSQLRCRTLLVDADLRRPSQHRLFNADNHVGLTQALIAGGGARLLGIEGLPHLWLLTAGPTAPNPSDLLGGERTEALVAQWRRDFQFVIVDNPPIGEFSDGLIMAALTGRVLILSRANISTHQSMKEMLRRLVSTQSRIVGSVINSF